MGLSASNTFYFNISYFGLKYDLEENIKNGKKYRIYRNYPEQNGEYKTEIRSVRYGLLRRLRYAGFRGGEILL